MIEVVEMIDFIWTFVRKGFGRYHDFTLYYKHYARPAR